MDADRNYFICGQQPTITVGGEYDFGTTSVKKYLEKPKFNFYKSVLLLPLNEVDR